jgi:hypothetical protein
LAKETNLWLVLLLLHRGVAWLLYHHRGQDLGPEHGLRLLLGVLPLRKGASDLNLSPLPLLGDRLGRLLQEVDGATLFLYRQKQVRPVSDTEVGKKIEDFIRGEGVHVPGVPAPSLDPHTTDE